MEAGAYAGWFRLDAAVPGDGGAGVGAWLTIPLAPWLAIDMDFAVSGAGRGATATVPAAALLLGAPAGRPGLFGGVGYARPRISGLAAGAVTDDALLGLAGYRLLLASRAALRFELRALYAPNSGLPGADGSFHTVAAAGVTLGTRAARPADEDRDGVPDNRDRCLATPGTSVVDEFGCPRDSDQDGVPNGADACPHTPGGTRVTDNGCPVDADGDGVFDGADQCPATPAGAGVDARGCPLDADQDGVFDGLDRCPGTPPGVVPDPNGCPADADGDGVFDGLDRCPGSPRGIPVDADGCPVRQPADTLFTPERRSLELRGVQFETGNARLLDVSARVLDDVAAALRAHPEVRVEVAGYTDSTGTAGVNLRLSRARAAAVRAFLIRAGVGPGRLIARGYGAADPVAPNSTADGRAHNRRVELRRID